jgi:hypothetical protein
MREIGEQICRVEGQRIAAVLTFIFNLQSIFKLVNVVTRLVPSSGRFFPMSMESTQPVPTTEPATFNWSESTFTSESEFIPFLEVVAAADFSASLCSNQ